MDGNGRWANSRGRPRTAGHIAGARVVRKIVEAAPDAGIGMLTLYAFSADNWARPSREVALLMRLFRRYLVAETDRCVTNDVRMRIIGRRDRIPGELLRAINAAEEATRQCERLELRIAVDYSSRDALVRAAEYLNRDEPVTREALSRAMCRVDHWDGPYRDVDLLIRTGGEQRLSDFLLWECAYAELYFTDRRWPDFTATDLQNAVAEFHSRERRFGTVPEAAAG
ncbi:MAG: di-trans,poly-cis-decaprenylcistransferase [Gemmatimonadetes bacterium]|jgi:undecaprenyl diphosphate synthase|nr:di-trans,poly-cis-decaprenylcistransferase [Gemmatimonadota bacterium]